MSEWPAHYPDGCPDCEQPEDANGTVYRFVVGDTPVREDCLSSYERKAYKKDPECMRRTLSCFLDLAEVKEIRESIGYRRTQRIAQVDLEPEHGKLKRTPGPDGASHVDVWVRDAHVATIHTRHKVIA